jgi:hypothetical protein
MVSLSPHGATLDSAARAAQQRHVESLLAETHSLSGQLAAASRAQKARPFTPIL